MKRLHINFLKIVGKRAGSLSQKQRSVTPSCLVIYV